MSIPELCEKYGVSKATVHRVLAEGGSERVSFAEETVSVNIPTTDNPVYEEFADVLNGRGASDEPPPVREKEKMNPMTEKAFERLADDMFHEDAPQEAMTMPKVKVDDPVEKTQVIQRIMLNLDNFGPMFTFIHDKQDFVASLSRKSVEELRGILRTMEQTRTTMNLANQIKNTFLMVGKATEVLAPKVFGLKTDGFVNTLLTQKQELDMIFRELAIDYAPKFTFQTRPEVRLAMLYGMTLLQVDNTNRLRDFVETKAEAPIPEATAQAFGDL